MTSVNCILYFNGKFTTIWSFFLQEKVACLNDNDARIALDPNEKYMIQVCLYFFHSNSANLFYIFMLTFVRYGFTD